MASARSRGPEAEWEDFRARTACLKKFTAPLAAGNGHLVNVMTGNKTENVMVGNRFRNVTLNEFVNVTGIQMIRAKLIFLN